MAVDAVKNLSLNLLVLQSIFIRSDIFCYLRYIKKETVQNSNQTTS